MNINLVPIKTWWNNLVAQVKAFFGKIKTFFTTFTITTGPKK